MLIQLALLAVVSLTARAAEPSAYTVIVQEERAGKKVESSSLVILERQKGNIRKASQNDSGTNFDVLVVPDKDGKLLVDYRFTETLNKKSVEIAKTAVPLSLGASETTHLQDSTGNDLTLKITVTKVVSVDPVGSDVKQRVPLHQ